MIKVDETQKNFSRRSNGVIYVDQKRPQGGIDVSSLLSEANSQDIDLAKASLKLITEEDIIEIRVFLEEFDYFLKNSI